MQNTDSKKDNDGPQLPVVIHGRLTVSTTQTTQTMRFEKFLSGPQGTGAQSPSSTDSYDSDEVRHIRFSQMARPTNHPVVPPLNISPPPPQATRKVWPEGLTNDSPKKGCCAIM